MFFTYLLRELNQRKRQTLLIAVALGTSIGLIIVVNAASVGIGDAQKTVLSGLYGIGTDVNVTKSVQPTRDGRGFNFGPGNANADGSTALSQTRLTIPPFSGTFDHNTLSQIANTEGVAKVSGTLRLTQMAFKGNIETGTLGTLEQTSPTEPQDPNTRRPSFGGGNFNVDITSVEGVDPNISTVGPLSGVKITSGRNFQTSDADSMNALVDSAYAKAQKIVSGATISIGGKNFTVIGIVASTSASPETASNVYIPISQAQILSDSTGLLTNIYISANSSANTASLQKDLQALLPNATVSSQAELAENLSGSLSSASTLVNAFSKWLSIIVLLVAFLIALLFTSSGVTRRIREFGTLKAIGWKTSRIVRQIMGESLVTSFIGATIGLAFGLIGIQVVNLIAPTLSAAVAIPGRFGGGGGNFQPPAGGFGGDGTGFGRAAANVTTLKLHIGMNLSTLFIAVAIAIVGGLIAGSFGSWRASRLSPAVALRSVA
jgi:ABC-type antimicrobial peptide transport system permease subunit